MARVSVLMSVRNNVRELPLAVTSILSQTLRDLELIVVDDGSTDGSGELLDRFAKHDPRVRVLHQPNTGLAVALNRAAESSSGQYLARQDADDISAPDRLARQLAYLETHPDVIHCSTWAWFVDPIEGPMMSYEPPDDHRLLVAMLERGSNPVVHGSTMMRRSAFMAEGNGYRLRRAAQDFDLWLRLVPYGRFGVLTSVGYLYTMSVGSVSYSTLGVRCSLVNLALQLHHERRVHGRETSSCRELEAEALLGAAQGQHSGDNASTAAYARALHRLRARDWEGYRGSMRSAASGSGDLAIRARRHLRWAWAAPVLRQAYLARERGTAQRYLRPLPPGTLLPAYASGTGDVPPLSAPTVGGS